MKQKYICLVTVLAFFAACQTELPAPESQQEMVDFSFTANLPDQLDTRTLPDSSQLGGINNVNPNDGWQLRCIMEVWTKGAHPVRVLRDSAYVKSNFKDASFTFSGRLVPMEYDFVFWADFIDIFNQKDYYYHTWGMDGLKDIEVSSRRYAAIDGTNLSAVEALDAYYHLDSLDLQTATNNRQVGLKRPFGKVRVLAKNQPAQEVVLKFSPSNNFFTVFNVFTGIASGNCDDVHQVSFNASPCMTQVNGQEFKGYLLAYYYFFTTVSGVETYALKLEDESGSQTFSNIPVERNKLTTIIIE